ncbi:MAG: hypothetical protein EOO53_00630 [Gammaproteobacteria bacterium]|nr:MAG: hypothetical protein EOO53_00630 [Gammaproteobacteria bacterium]
MRSKFTSMLGVCLFAASAYTVASAQPIYLDSEGVIRWQASKEEVRLFGANYCAFSGSDYRMAEMVGADHKALIDADMGHFARMGWDAMRLCSWGDWENADGLGNLVENKQSDLMDYLVSKASERGIQMLLTPIHTYNPAYADKFGDDSYKPAGFSSLYPRDILGTEPKAIAAESNYVQQLLNHVNPYSKKALKDEPNILFVEMINEPIHHPENLQQSVGYINTLVDAVRKTGSEQITFHNYSQDFKILDSLAESKVQGVSFGWYPSGLVSGHTQQGNFLQSVDKYPDLLNSKISNKPRIVYEFDQGDLNTGYLFPAMARTYRSVGAQFAAVFAYDMLETAPYNLGWQTHFINLVHTPRQAVSAVIAGEAMRRLPRLQQYGNYPENTEFGDFSVDYATDSSLLNAPDAFINAGDTKVAPRKPAELSRLVGFGSSSIINYEGTGAYFLDKVRDGIWRLEVYPDEILVSDPFAQPRLDKIVSRLYFKSWPMTIKLPDLGARFNAEPLTLPAGSSGNKQVAKNSVINAAPGVWLLTKKTDVNSDSLPATINRVGFKEYHINAPKTYPDLIQTLAPSEFINDQHVQINVRLASKNLPENLSLYIRAVGGNFDKPIAMKRIRGYDYSASLPANHLPVGNYEYVVTLTENGRATSFPGAFAGQPGLWPFAAENPWTFSINSAQIDLTIFNPKQDISSLSFVRLSEKERTVFHKLVAGESTSQNALSLRVQPFANGEMPAHYAGGLYIGDKISAREKLAAQAKTIDVRVRATNSNRKTLEIYLIEKDGSSWRGNVVAQKEWATQRIPLESLTFAKSLLIPTPFPGLWNYWREGPKARANSKIQVENIERLELRVYPNQGETGSDDANSLEVESVQLGYTAEK